MSFRLRLDSDSFFLTYDPAMILVPLLAEVFPSAGERLTAATEAPHKFPASIGAREREGERRGHQPLERHFRQRQQPVNLRLFYTDNITIRR